MIEELKAGDRIGKWTLVRPTLKVTGRTRAYWVCRCACGAEHLRRTGDLRARRTSACSKCIPRKKPARTFTVGDRFGSWTLVRKTKDGPRAKERIWLTACECGYKAIKSEDALVRKDHQAPSKCQTCTNQEIAKRCKK